jgi:hypothetical protein
MGGFRPRISAGFGRAGRSPVLRNGGRGWVFPDQPHHPKVLQGVTPGLQGVCHALD